LLDNGKRSALVIGAETFRFFSQEKKKTATLEGTLRVV
jgi:hypothetical protein